MDKVKAEKGIWTSLERGVNRHVVYTLLIVAVGYSILYPIGLPILMSDETIKVYELIDSLPTGAKVAVAYDMYGGPWGEIGASSIAVMQHLFSKDITMIVFAVADPSGPTLFEDNCIPGIDKYGKEYGTDWVNLGYFVGEEAAIAALAFDTKNIALKDHFGTPINELPVMEGFNSAEDWDLLVQIGVYNVERYLRQVQVPFDVKHIYITGLMQLVTAMPYIESEQVHSAVAGIRGGAEYEALINKPGDASANLDALTMAYIIALGLAILGNASYFVSKTKKRGV